MTGNADRYGSVPAREVILGRWVREGEPGRFVRIGIPGGGRRRVPCRRFDRSHLDSPRARRGGAVRRLPAVPRHGLSTRFPYRARTKAAPWTLPRAELAPLPAESADCQAPPWLRSAGAGAARVRSWSRSVTPPRYSARRIEPKQCHSPARRRSSQPGWFCWLACGAATTCTEFASGLSAAR